MTVETVIRRRADSRSRLAVVLAALGAVALVGAGCVGAGATTQPNVPGGPGSNAPSSAQPSGGSGFYLRAWQTQAIAPDRSFIWLPLVTIADGQFIDGNVAIPMIYPGPVFVQPDARPISQAGIDAIVAEAGADGVLSGQPDCGSMPGSIVGHLQLTVNGTTQELACGIPAGGAISAPPSAGAASAALSAGAATTAGFVAFWNKITSLGSWLSADLGAAAGYTPARLAVLLTPPAAPQFALTQNQASWPLAGDMSSFGTAFSGDMRCGVVSGADLAPLLTVARSANQLTVLVDGSGGKASLEARVLVPGEPDPCAPGA
jgi:hypothetical protein